MTDYITHHITWRGMAITIRHAAGWPIPEYDHIEVMSEGSKPLPITETGYRSHFLLSVDAAEYGNAIGYVTAWLDHEAKAGDWTIREDEERQMTLF